MKVCNRTKGESVPVSSCRKVREITLGYRELSNPGYRSRRFLKFPIKLYICFFKHDTLGQG